MQFTVNLGHQSTKTFHTMQSAEKLCLQWNDFQNILSSAFGDLRGDTDFTDVTLACEDGQQVEAHKVILISSSPFFLNLLKRNKHPHQLVYMRALKYGNLVSMVDFLYHGEANVYQDNLDSFLALADELQLKGLKREEEIEPDPKIASKTNRQIMKPSKTANCSIATSKDIPPAAIGIENIIGMFYSPETAIALNSFPVDAYLEELDQKVKSMMIVSENQIDKRHGEGRVPNGKARICTVCGKEGRRINIMQHIEANHMTNISIPCNACGKTMKTRHALNQHKCKNCPPGSKNVKSS